MLKEMLGLMRVQGHRVLLFSQTTQLMDLLEAFLRQYSFSHLRMDGKTPIAKRQRLMDEFSNGNVFVFLLSTRACGLGVNLTGEYLFRNASITQLHYHKYFTFNYSHLGTTGEVNSTKFSHVLVNLILRFDSGQSCHYL